MERVCHSHVSFYPRLANEVMAFLVAWRVDTNWFGLVWIKLKQTSNEWASTIIIVLCVVGYTVKTVFVNSKVFIIFAKVHFLYFSPFCFKYSLDDTGSVLQLVLNILFTECRKLVVNDFRGINLDVTWNSYFDIVINFTCEYSYYSDIHSRFYNWLFCLL